jgi:hypothetical protein
MLFCVAEAYNAMTSTVLSIAHAPSGVGVTTVYSVVLTV